MRATGAPVVLPGPDHRAGGQCLEVLGPSRLVLPNHALHVVGDLEGRDRATGTLVTCGNASAAWFSTI